MEASHSLILHAGRTFVMAGASRKRIHESNKAHTRLLLITVGASLLVQVLKFYFTRSSTYSTSYSVIIALACELALATTCYLYIAAAAKPLVSPSGEIIDAGTDVKARAGTGGAISYAHDGLYISVAAMALATISTWFHALMLLPPAFGLYLAWKYIIAPYVFTPTEKERPETAAEKKAREKRERKERKWGR